MAKFRRTIMVTAVAALAVTALSGTPANAESVCLESNSYRFTAPLDLVDKLGTARVNYAVTCIGANVYTNPLGVEPTPGGGAGAFDYTYDGTCILASLYNDFFQGFLIGGAVEVEIGTTNLPYGYAKIGALVPNFPCAESSAVSVEASVNYRKVP